MDERIGRTWWGAFDVAFAPVMRRRLHVRPSGPLPDVRGPLVIVANHVSWWDGFVLRAVQRALRPHATLRTVALARELERHPFLRRLGAIALDPSSPSSILHMLRTVESLRTDDLVLGYFPGGRIVPSHARPLGFHRGIDLVLRALEPVTVLPVGIHIEPLSRFAPTAFVAIGAPVEGTATDHEQLEQRVTQLLDDLLTFTATHGEDADRAWPGFRPRAFDDETAAPSRPRLVC